MKARLIIVLAMVSGLLGAGSLAQARADGGKVMHVWQESPTSQIPYPSKLTASISVAPALAIAEPGDTVIVHGDCKNRKPCTYAENLVVPCGVALLGTGTAGWTPILDGMRKGRVVAGAGEGCPSGQANTVAYFCIQHGVTPREGGGIYFINRRVTIENNCIWENEARIGAGIAVVLTDPSIEWSRALIKGNLIERNLATWRGGGISIQADYKNPSGERHSYHARLEKNTIRKNMVRAKSGYLWGGGLDVFRARVSAYANLFEENTVILSQRGAEGPGRGYEAYGAHVGVMGLDENSFNAKAELAANAVGIAKTLVPPAELDVEQYFSMANIYRAGNGLGAMRGGAVATIFNTSAHFLGDLIEGNNAMIGGATYSSARSLQELVSVRVEKNYASRDGGGLYISCDSRVHLIGGNLIEENTSAQPGSRHGGGGGGIYARNSEVIFDNRTNQANQVSGNAANGGKGGGMLLWEVNKALLLKEHGNGSLQSWGEAAICNGPRTRAHVSGENLFARNVASRGGGIAIVLSDDRSGRAFIRSAILDRTQVLENKAHFGGGIYYEEHKPRDLRWGREAVIAGALIAKNVHWGIAVAHAGEIDDSFGGRRGHPALVILGNLIEDNTGGVAIYRSNTLLKQNHIRINAGTQLWVKATKDEALTLPVDVRENDFMGLSTSRDGIHVVGGRSARAPARWHENNLTGHTRYAAISDAYVINMRANWWGQAAPATDPAAGNAVNGNVLATPALGQPVGIPMPAFGTIDVDPISPDEPALPGCTVNPAEGPIEPEEEHKIPPEPEDEHGQLPPDQSGNQDPVPTLAVNDVSVTEGASGTTTAVFEVTLSAASSRRVEVGYATGNRTASAPADYAASAGTLVIEPGEVKGTVSVPVAGDSVDEADETFVLDLSNPVNATIGDGQGVGTILDDDDAPTLSITDVSVKEGDAGTVDATFTVTLSGASGRTVTVEFATADGSAVAAEDYIASRGTLTFSPGQTSTTVVVQVMGDETAEPDEVFCVSLSNPVDATIADGQGDGTVQDDDHH